MKQLNTFYIDGEWVEASASASVTDVVDPSTEAVIGKLSMGGEEDVERAVAAARAALPEWSRTSREVRLALFERIVECYKARLADLAAAVTEEMGAPAWLSRELHAPSGLAQFMATFAALKDFSFETEQGSTRIVHEPIGVAALITPWNWPLNQIVAKVAPALAAGCTIVLKPSEVSALDARIFAEILQEAGVPRGVFNMIYGEGPRVGAALSGHRDVDMVSITGSTRAGVAVAIQAAPTVKRVAQELGGKSPCLIFDDADLTTAVSASVASCMMNSGQTCIAPTRMLVSRRHYAAAVEIAMATAQRLNVGDPRDPASKLGPVASRAQFERVQQMIETGMREGARLVAGGPGRPEGLERGFYVRPTVFADVRPDMAIAREEVFGPVLVMLAYDDEADAIAMANDTDYGLAAYIWSSDPARVRRVSAELRAGAVLINGARMDLTAPFGGYKASGNGREFGKYGLAEFLETKSVVA